MASQLRQTLIGTSVVGAILGLLPASGLVLFAFLDTPDDDLGPAFVLQFDPDYLGYALAVLVGAVLISTLLFGLLPWLVHQAIAWVARRRQA